MEPQWNPTVEAQAIGRALRFGQERQVTIIRYIMHNTVEEVREIRSTAVRVLSPTVYPKPATAKATACESRSEHFRRREQGRKP